MRLTMGACPNGAQKSIWRFCGWEIHCRVSAQQVQSAIGSMAHSTTDTNIGNAWEALTAQQKADSLAKVMREEAKQVIPRILSK